MYKQIEAGLILSGISKKELAQKLGIAYNTLLIKLKGESPFTLDEAFKIRDCLNKSMPIDEMFKRSQISA